MIFNKDGTLEGKPKCVVLSVVEKECYNNLTITRGGNNVTITPSQTPVVWLPHAPAVGGEGSPGVANFEAATLGQYLHSHEDTTVVPKCKGLVRPVFEMKASLSSEGPQGAYALMPGAAPGQSALWLFTTKKMRPQVRALCF